MARDNSFDALRLLGAVLVIVGHSYVLLGADAPRIAGIEVHGLGVKMFFVISGFLITGSYIRDSNLVRYATRRALRIMPALIAVVLLTVVGFAFVSTADFGTYVMGAAKYFVRNVMLLPYHELPGVFAANPYPVAVNGSLWTLPVEVFMYVLTPLIVLAGSRVGILACGAVLLIIPVTGSVLGFGLSGAADVIPYYLFGAAVQLSRSALPTWTVPTSLAIILVAGFMNAPEIIVAVPLTILVLGIGRSPVLRGLPADISYGTYLLAYPVQQLIISLVPDISPLALIAATLAVVAPLALLSWRLIEQPALALAKSRVAAAPVLKGA